MEDSEWTVRSILSWTEGYLERHGDESPRLSAELLLADVLDASRVELYLDMDRPLLAEELATYRTYVSRRGSGEPIQYITGSAPFRHITLTVRPGVLIPRPETEVLVSEALALFPQRLQREVKWSAESKAQEDEAVHAVIEALSEAGAFNQAAGGEEAEGAEQEAPDAANHTDTGAQQPYLVADIGTGTGAIACSIAYERPDTNVIATDISPEAVALARENCAALLLDERVKVLECNLGDGIPERYMGRFDLVISNPPYIPSGLLNNLPTEVTSYEPRLALDGGEDGNDIARQLLTWAQTALVCDGWCCLELHEDCLDDAAAFAQNAGYTSCIIKNDLAGRPRVLLCQK